MTCVNCGREGDSLSYRHCETDSVVCDEVSSDGDYMVFEPLPEGVLFVRGTEEL
jgi:hypothetical protein